MKKNTAKLTAMAVSVSLLMPALSVPAFADQDETAEVGFAQCTEYINIRSGADTDSEIVGKIYNNGKMDILEETEDGWYHIRSGNVSGYIKADYVVTGEAAQQIAETAGYTTAEVGAYSLNIRQEMSSDAEVVGAAEEGQELEVVQDNGDWVKVVTTDGVYGYVSSDYVYTSTEYRLAETLEEEQARLDAQWLRYLAAQGADVAADTADYAQAAAEEAQSDADAQYQAYLDAQAAADTAAAEAADTSYDDTVYEDTSADTTASADTAADDSASQAQAEADAQYQAYLDAQAAADSAAATAEAAANAAQQVSEQTSSDSSYTEDTSYTDSSSASEDTSYTEDTASSDTSASTGSATGQAIADYATQFVGNPYVYGGSSLTSGADCSGFVMAVFANFGISLPHYSGSQMGYGTAVDASSLAPGDLVFYGAGGSQHVAIYIGGGSIVHAANSSTGITITGISWPGTPTGYRRLV